MKIHLVAIGGSVMHNLALDLALTGHQVTGSDDEFYEPSRSRLKEAGLLPLRTGWFPEKIDHSLDCVITGMHAKGDNPEISRALELGLRVYSFPEFFGERCRNKLRIVVAGSHGKTTTTAMIMHALKGAGRDFDYLVGASPEGFERNVRLSDAPICVIEGDEYPSSPLDPRPKIMHYNPDITIITGVAWDHMNVFPTWESYVQVFRDFISGLCAETRLIWFEEDEVLAKLVKDNGIHLKSIPYRALEMARGRKKHESTIPDCDPAAMTRVYDGHGKIYAMRIFGSHNLQNMAAAGLACAEIGIPETEFLSTMQDFPGASMRLQLLHQRDGLIVYRDFAHAPSKVNATVKAVRERYPETFLVACLELHSYSSLNTAFIPQYKGTLDKADHALIFYSPKTLEIKKMPMISPSDITEAFTHHSLEVVTNKKTLEGRLRFFANVKENTVMLLMSSGRFENVDLDIILKC
ncbi:MAG TPA: Mur ligase family protein [Saprospiraceae bacterium]|nr:Mur ligase family protein [Saprospiraceae bacterium]